MDELQQMCEVVGRVDAVLFARSRPGVYLLGKYPSAPGAAAAASNRKSFHTSPAISVDEMMALLRQESTPGLVGQFLRKVEKSPRNPFRGRISVGRAGNNDVVITHPSLSKLHAHFLVEDTLPSVAAGALRIVDVGSSNGTWVDGRRLPPDHPAILRPGAEIRLGDLQCQLLDAEALYRVLRRALG